MFRLGVRLLLAGWVLTLAWASDSEDKLEPVRTTITVMESVETESPAVLTALDGSGIRSIPGVNIDDRLRNLPGFSLFRRNSSLVAHPTTQGVSLRGIGSSGTSRSLVLWDGIPVNDPFGGWVYWTRFQPEELERVEVSRGASTSVFGDRAMGGAIALFSRRPEHRRLHARYEAGNRGTHDLAGGYSHLFSRWGVSGQVRGYTMDGFFVVPVGTRGAIDREAGVRFVVADARVDYLGPVHRWFFKSDLLTEDRANGTVLQNNSTGLGTVAARYQTEKDRHSVSVLGYHTRGEFRSAFSAIAAGRNTETLTFRQTVPSEAVGGAGLWGYRGQGWNLLGGADLFRVEGQSIESPRVGARRQAGGTLRQNGVFLQSDLTWKTLRLFAGGREQYAGAGNRFFSPSGGLVAGRGRFRGRGSVYRSFRVPTLNELYREFRVGNAVTQANAQLRPESLFGAEAGLDIVGELTRTRITFYRNELTDLITNVTLSVAPNLIVRQRQNAGGALSRGFEIDTARRWGPLRGEASYLFVDSRFAVGERVPQIPKHQGSAQVTFDRGATLASIGIRSYAAQFEDELNRFLLPGYATLQVVARRQLTPRLSALVAFENLLNREFVTGFSPTPLIGAPRLWRAGLRWEGRL
ncbi:MAG: TonB-dependent receptor [Bryobacterales bacterium]|nr:TonB-dependent receptor [Bryobacterales bacterium]